MEAKYYKMDLHIHTPASHCYQDCIGDETYYKILDQMCKQNIDIVAITDHNTIEGYKRIIELIASMELKVQVLSEFKDTSEEIASKINELQEKLKAYKSLKILPGVELTLNPGVHIIVIADNNDADELSSLLDEIGYTEEHRGNDSDFIPNVDVKFFLDNKYLKNKLIIAPHVDSNNGIYNELSGNYRAEIFKSLKLNAITCNSHKTLSKIKSLIINEPAYKRSTQLAYINASDAHNINAIGNKTSYILLEKLDFKNIVDAFLSPTRCISDIKNPNITQIIENLVQSDKVILIEDIEKSNEAMAKLLCACENSEFNAIILGIDRLHNVVGTKITEDELSELIEKGAEFLEIQSGRLSYKILPENLGTGRNVYIIIKRSTIRDLVYLKNENSVFIYKNDIIRASISEIREIIRNRLLNDLEKLEIENTGIIETTINSLIGLKKPINKYRLLLDVERLSSTLSKYVTVTTVQNTSNADYWRSISLDIGSPEGNIYYALNQKIRLDDCVLRFSCPVISEDIQELSNLELYRGMGIVLTQSGGSYIISEEEFYLETLDDAILVQLKPEYASKISLYAILGWLKSSLFIWAIYRRCNSTELYYPEVFNNIVLPNLEIFNVNCVIEEKVLRIIQLEKELLSTISEMRGNSDGITCKREVCIEKINEIIDKHNIQISCISKEIDEVVFSSLHIESEKRSMIGQDISMFNIYNIL